MYIHKIRVPKINLRYSEKTDLNRTRMNTDKNNLFRLRRRKTYINSLIGNAADRDWKSITPLKLQAFFRRQADLINPC